MALRKGIVVATHPEDYSVDLVMVDNGERVSGVQVMASNASGRTGSVDLPAVPERKNKWDVTEDTGQDMHAMVDYVGRVPVVTGFLYPQINQMLFKDPKMKFNRHQSDVMDYIDGKGNFGIIHPSGAFIQVGDKPDLPDFPKQNADATLVADRNTDTKVYMRISLAGQKVEITLSPDGTATMKMEKDFNVECKNAKIKASDGIEFDTPKAHFTGEVTSDGDMKAGNISLQKHKTSGVKGGTDTSDVPVPG